MPIFGSKPGPAPCPVCDTELGPDADPRTTERCPSCGAALVAVTTARTWRRAAAFAIDLGVLALTAGPIAWLLGRALGLSPLTDGKGIDALLQILADDLWRPVGRAMPFLIMAVVYFALFGALRGQTLGQRALGIRVVDMAGAMPGPPRSVLRALASVASLIPLGLGAIWMAFDLETRAVHDHLTRTWVVRQA